MPRYRKLYTKTVESLDVNDMPDDFTRLFWVLLPLALCREGRGLNNPAWLRSKLFPLREDVTQEQVELAFDWFIQRGMVVQYAVDGREYFYVPSFHTYQGNTVKEAESDYPAPQSPVETGSRVSPELVQSKSGTDADAVFSMQMQYSDADASSVSDDVDDALESIGMDQIPAVIKEATDAGLTPAQIIDTCAWAMEKNKSPAIVRTMLRQGEAHRPRAPDDGRKRYVSGKYADIIEQ